MQIVKLLRHGDNLGAPVGEGIQNGRIGPIARRMSAHLGDEVHRDAQILAKVANEDTQRCYVVRWLTKSLREHGRDPIGTIPQLIAKHHHKRDIATLFGLREPGDENVKSIDDSNAGYDAYAHRNPISEAAWSNRKRQFGWFDGGIADHIVRSLQ